MVDCLRAAGIETRMVRDGFAVSRSLVTGLPVVAFEISVSQAGLDFPWHWIVQLWTDDQRTAVPYSDLANEPLADSIISEMATVLPTPEATHRFHGMPSPDVADLAGSGLAFTRPVSLLDAGSIQGTGSSPGLGMRKQGYERGLTEGLRGREDENPLARRPS